jgi:hypothetical protein
LGWSTLGGEALIRLPSEECVRSWTVWETSGFNHRLFDEYTAGAFISSSLTARHKRAFERCYHPAMQAEYFRLCYVLAEGGFYIDADDVSIGTDIGWLVEDGRLKLQPLCYDIATEDMVEPAVFLRAGAYDPNWIFYLSNNPLIAGPGHPLIDYALSQATRLLELAGEDELPEIQMATGPGNISKSIFELGTRTNGGIESNIVALRDWDSIAVSKWPLSYRGDARKFGDYLTKRDLIVVDSLNESFEAVVLSVANYPCAILARSIPSPTTALRDVWRRF